MGCGSSQTITQEFDRSFGQAQQQFGNVRVSYPQTFQTGVVKTTVPVPHHPVPVPHHPIPPVPVPVPVPMYVPAPPPKPKVEITEDMVRNFESIGVVITELERKSIMVTYNEKQRQQEEIERELITLTQKFKELQNKTAALSPSNAENAELEEIKRLDSLVKYFSTQELYDKQMSQQEEEFVQAKSELEDCEKRLQSLRVDLTRITDDMKTLKADRDELMKLYNEQDQILELAFGGVYGSSEEDKLEQNLDKLNKKNQRINLTMQHWKNAKSLVETSQKQLDFACKRWIDIGHIPATPLYQMLRVQVITDARHYLLAASRNLSSSHRYFHPVNLPYCDPNEVATLNRAISYIYIDGLSRERHAHAFNVFRTTAARSQLLVKWVDTVIQEKISVDLRESNMQTRECSQALRRERMRLMTEKVETETGKKIVFDNESTELAGVDEKASNEVIVAVAVAEAEEVEEAGDLDEQIQQAKDNVEEGDQINLAPPVPLPLEELAPAPSSNQIFGDLDMIMAEYGRQKQEMEQHKEEEKARQEADLMEKVRRRRSRKMRMLEQGVES